MALSVLYFFLAGLVVAASILILLTPHVLYAALGLLGVLLGMSAIYFLQGAAFIAVAQILVYGGGVLVLLLFSSLLLPLATRPTPICRRWTFVGPVVLLLGVFLWPLVLEAGQFLHAQAPVVIVSDDIVVMLGFQLVGPYALAFEWTGVILLVALIGALYLLKPHA